MSVLLSVVIPAYNEADRLPRYLETIRPYFTSAAVSYEILVVDDGSTDSLAEAVQALARTWRNLRLLRHVQNRGKGAAIRTGMRAAGGTFLLFTDADGATPIAEERKLRAALEAGAEIAVGSRLVGQAGVVRDRLWWRNWCGRSFAGVVRRLFRLSVHDTQCGFKMFRRAAGLRLFQNCRQAGYLFDVEVLVLARAWGYEIVEVPVSWTDVPGSKVQLVRDAWRMLRGLWRIWRAARRLQRSGVGQLDGPPARQWV